MTEGYHFCRLPRQTLTEREVEVLALVSRGLSNRQIAETLGIGPGTVSGYMHSIMDKLNVSSRQEAVEAVERIGR